MIRTVYIETTIPSYYHETRSTVSARAWRAATRLWWTGQRNRYQLCTSEYTIAELKMSPPAKARRCLALLRGVPQLPEPPGLQEVIEYYIGHRLMPAEAGGDAAHLAMTSMHHVDCLLTWNCRHLANINKLEHLSILNERLGLPVPQITTPLTFMQEESP